MGVYVIYLADTIILTRQVYPDGWREIQNKYPDFKSSLGPWSKEDVKDYIKNEYSDEWPKLKNKVIEFLNNDALDCVL